LGNRGKRNDAGANRLAGHGEGGQTMPLYMDIHKNMQGLTADAVAQAHQKDLEVQGKHGVNFRSYWYNEAEGMIFCLCEAPSKEAAAAVHREAHGEMPVEVIEVREGS
jgi:hypothetical protein